MSNWAQIRIFILERLLHWCWLFGLSFLLFFILLFFYNYCMERKNKNNNNLKRAAVSITCMWDWMMIGLTQSRIKMMKKNSKNSKKAQQTPSAAMSKNNESCNSKCLFSHSICIDALHFQVLTWKLFCSFNCNSLLSQSYLESEERNWFLC